MFRHLKVIKIIKIVNIYMGNHTNELTDVKYTSNIK